MYFSPFSTPTFYLSLHRAPKKAPATLNRRPMMGSLTSRFFLSLALISSVVGAHGRVLSRKPPARVPLVRDSVEQNVTSRALEKRFDGARFTFYDAGLGACGKVNSGSDFVRIISFTIYYMPHQKS